MSDNKKIFVSSSPLPAARSGVLTGFECACTAQVSLACATRRAAFGQDCAGRAADPTSVMLGRT
ncbi:MAG: hypothetical protein NVS2B16_37810 [Chloroflexota bacterium]